MTTISLPNANQTAGQPVGTVSLAELIDQLSHFEGPPDQFLERLLRGQCAIASASCGAILRATTDAAGEPGVEVLATTPALPTSTANKQENQPFWLAGAIELTPRVFSQAITLVSALRHPDELYEDTPQRYLIMLPLLGKTKNAPAGQSQNQSQKDAAPISETGVRGAAAFLVESTNLREINEASQKLELTTNLLSMYELRLTLAQRRGDLQRLGKSLESLDALSEHDALGAATLAMCNHVAAVWKCERVALGFVEGRYVKLRALSHTERFSRKMKLVQSLEMVMEECADQDLEIIHPTPADTTFVSRAAADLSRQYGAATVVSVPLRREGKVIAVLTLERAADAALTVDDVESLRLACELCTPRLADLHDHGRWFGARMVTGMRKSAQVIVGPKHTWVKLAAIGLFVAALFLAFARGEYRVDSSFVILAPEKRVVPAPFEGYLQAVEVEPGDAVFAGKTVLAELDTAQLQLELAAALAEQARYEKQGSLAMRDDKAVEVQMAKAQADQIRARVDLLQNQISRAKLISPIDGIVLTGDWSQQIGAPVRTGDLLFEIAPMRGLRADLSVPESRIADLEVGQLGVLATASHPSETMKIQVERIHPIAEVLNQQNVFQVRVRIVDAEPWLRPGMEGVAKVDAGRRHYAWIWTRELINWVRMRWWL